MNPHEKTALDDFIRRVVRTDLAVVGAYLVVSEHRQRNLAATLALQRADRGYVLAGRMNPSGPTAELVADKRVRRAYLG